MFGLTPDIIRSIKEAFSKFSQIEKVILYGSRAKGNYKDGSDIDITLLGNNLNLKTVYALETIIDELYLPYTFDISIFAHIDNDDLVEHILSVGKVFYVKKDVELPVGWDVKKLGEVCNIIGGGTPSKKKEEFYNGNILWATVRDMNADIIKNTEHKITIEAVRNSSTNIIPKENIIIATRVGLGKVCLLQNDTAINQDLKGIIPINQKKLSIEFLFRWFKNNSKKVIDEGTGATVQGLKLPFIKSLVIHLPPLPEQKRIVAILDKAFAAIEKAKNNAEQNLKNAKELFESYLQGVFENKGDGWEETTLGDVCDLYQGIAINAKTKHALVEKSDFPLLRIKDLKNNTVEQYIDPNNFPKNALVNEDDIIYTRTGSLGLVFRGKRGVLHNNSFKVVPNDKLDKDFLFIWLQNPIFKSKILELALRAAQPDITHAIFKIQIIAIPPLKKQQTIVKKLDALLAETKKLEVIYQKKIDDLEELKKSVLQKAFNGEL